MDILEQTKEKMKAAIEHFKNDLKNIRTGRANPGMVENIMVEVYGSSMRLKDIASITVPEARQLLITPFDPKNTPHVGKAIEKANIGFMPIVDGNLVRIKIPSMTEELRKKMAKLCHEESEKAKIIIRNIRRDSNEKVRKQKADGDIAEDRLKKNEQEIQKLTDEFCEKVTVLAKEKEKEISVI